MTDTPSRSWTEIIGRIHHNDAALILVAANKPDIVVTRELALLFIALSGSKQIVVAINKMESIDWSQNTFAALSQ